MKTLQEALASCPRHIIYYLRGSTFSNWSIATREGGEFLEGVHADPRLDRCMEKVLGLAPGSIVLSAAEADAVSQIENAPLEHLQSVAGADYRVFVAEWWPESKWAVNGWLRPLELAAPAKAAE